MRIPLLQGTAEVRPCHRDSGRSRVPRQSLDLHYLTKAMLSTLCSDNESQLHPAPKQFPSIHICSCVSAVFAQDTFPCMVCSAPQAQPCTTEMYLLQIALWEMGWKRNPKCSCHGWDCRAQNHRPGRALQGRALHSMKRPFSSGREKQKEILHRC